MVLILHRAGAAARLRPVVRCLERGEEINNQWPELRQQQQPHTAADLAFDIDTSICNNYETEDLVSRTK